MAIDNEVLRLKAMESAYDQGTVRLIESLDLQENADCLEVAAGAGSVAAWMRETFTGRIVAVDIDARHLSELIDVEIIEADIRTVEIGSKLDLVHARFLLDLMPEPTTIIDRLARMVRPGGFLVLEEFDDLTASMCLGSAEDTERHEAVVRAKQRVFKSSGHDNFFARKLPGLVAANAWDAIEGRFRGGVRQGGSAGTDAWMRYVMNQREALVHEGGLPHALIDTYLSQLSRPSFFFFSPMVVAVIAHKSPS